jgi:fructokinase
MKITSIGEILYDVYPDRKRLGGAPFNFIYHIKKITGKGNFISSLGKDDNGKEILDYLTFAGFKTDNISIDEQHPTGTVIVKLLEDKTPQFKIAPECSYDFIELNERTIELIEKETDLLYFGTLSQRGKTTRNTIESLFNRNIKFFCDLNLRQDFFTKEMIEKALFASNVMKININELETLKTYFNLPDAPIKAVERLIHEFKIDLCCVTMGEEGALIHDRKSYNEYKGIPLKVIDTVGAGDAFASILAIGFLKNWNLEKINKLANDFAAVICGIEGALPEKENIYHKFIREFENDS